MASKGYVVLYVNPRGSTSYGEEFGHLIHHASPATGWLRYFMLPNGLRSIVIFRVPRRRIRICSLTVKVAALIRRLSEGFYLLKHFVSPQAGDNNLSYISERVHCCAVSVSLREPQRKPVKLINLMVAVSLNALLQLAVTVEF
ncbi:MAG: prolyl oligopeptidase family serine peptidase [Gammaproteobacteria bacterium]|nr:prolyl oligopeptidase family serine peptidase [Gammaproteobacteria bacterium]